MILQYLNLCNEYKAFIATHSQTKCLKLTNEEKLALHQIAFVLKPFKDMTLDVSDSIPSTVRSLEKYWDLNDILEQVTTGAGKYTKLDQYI